MKRILNQKTFSDKWQTFLEQRGRLMQKPHCNNNYYSMPKNNDKSSNKRCVGHYDVFKTYSNQCFLKGWDSRGLEHIAFKGDGYYVNLQSAEILEGVYFDFGSYEGDFSNLACKQIKPTLNFGLMQKGSYKAILDKRNFWLSQGQIYIVAPDTHYIKSESDVKCECVQISIDIEVAKNELAKIFRNFSLAEFYENMQNNALTFNSNVCQKRLFDALCWTNDIDLLRLMVLESVLAMKKCCEQRCNEAIKCYKKSYIKEVVSYILANLLEEISLRDLSELFDVSVSKLTQDFKSTQGMSIYQFIKAQRMQYAAAHLRKGQENITQIALNLGYVNMSAFAKSFKEIYGVSPSEYRYRFKCPLDF